MERQRMRYGYALRLDPGEEIVAALTAFAGEQGLRAAMLSGIGSVGEPELGYFVRASREYRTRRFTGDYEIASLTGNLSELDGKPFPHCHVVLGDLECGAIAGHLFRGVVTVTCEIQVVTDPGILRRVRRDDLGFNPLTLGG